MTWGFTRKVTFSTPEGKQKLAECRLRITGTQRKVKKTSKKLKPRWVRFQRKVGVSPPSRGTAAVYDRKGCK